MSRADLAPLNSIGLSDRKSHRPPSLNLLQSSSSPTRPSATNPSRTRIRPSSPPVLSPPPLSASRRKSQAPLMSPSHTLIHSARPEELAVFSDLCRAFYFEGDQAASKAIDQTLNNLPLPSRAVYTKTMASVRAEFHAYDERRRRRKLYEIMGKTTPSGTVIKNVGGGSSTAALRGGKARQIRKESLARFIRNHCLRSLPGPIPFFKALHGALYLQSLQPKKGGAGSRQIEWEIDDAVWLENGGDFLDEGLELLKGVLGFEERVAPKRVEESIYEDEQEEMADGGPAEPTSRTTTTTETDPGASTPRPRSSSDPFLDPQSRALLSTSPSPRDANVSDPMDDLPCVTTRIYSMPVWMTNPECRALLRLFPSYITQGAGSVRFASADDNHQWKPDLEEAVGGDFVRIGTGSLRIGMVERAPGFKGTTLERIMGFFSWLFGR